MLVCRRTRSLLRFVVGDLDLDLLMDLGGLVDGDLGSNTGDLRLGSSRWNGETRFDGTGSGE